MGFRKASHTLSHCWYLQTLISLTAMYETALVQGQPAPNAAEFNTYAFIMLLTGTRQKDAPTAFFQVSCGLTLLCSWPTDCPQSSLPFVAKGSYCQFLHNDLCPALFYRQYLCA